MKVLLVNTYDTGGAANACIRLHLALIESGVDSHLLTADKTRFDIPNHYDYETFTGHKAGNILNRVSELIVDNKHIYSSQDIKNISLAASVFTDVFSTIYSDYRIEDAPSISEYDVINLHWTSRFLNWPTFFASANIKQVVWSLHDMAPFTGGYHYSDGFEGYKTDDSNPHFLRQTRDPDFAKKILAAKKNILSKTTIPIGVVTLSKWLHSCSNDSALFCDYPKKLIKNSVDIEVFNFGEKQAARKRLQLDSSKQIILFVSDSLINKRKGFHLLEDALIKTKDNEIMLCAVGNHFTSTLTSSVSFGKVTDDNLLADIYRSADIFVLPTLEDNLPNVVVEALCCGTPVVGFDIGGMPDMVINGENGILSKDISAQGLFDAIEKCLNVGVSQSAREISNNACSIFKYSNQSELFKQFTEELIG